MNTVIATRRGGRRHNLRRAGRGSPTGAGSIVVLVALFAVVIAVGLWALLKDPGADPIAPLPEAAQPKAVKAPARRPPPRPSARPVDIPSVTSPPPATVTAAPAAPTRSRPGSSGADRASHTSHSELLAWIKATDTITDWARKKEVLVELGRELAAESFTHALDLARGISDGAVRRFLYEGIFALQAASDPRGALRAAQAFNPERGGPASAARTREAREDYYTVMLAVMAEWADRDPRAARDYLAELPQGLHTRAAMTVYEAWAKKAPEAALAAANEIESGLHDAVLQSVVNGWAQSDPAGAARYANGLEDDGLRVRLFNAITKGFLETWDQRDSRTTADWAVEVFPDELLQRLLPTMYSRWSAADPASAAEHALQLNRHYHLDIQNTMGSILRQWAQSDLDAAIQWIDQRFASDEDYVWAVSTLINSIRYTSPEKTAKLLEKVPFTYADGTEGANEVARLMAAWCIKDPKSAVAWAESLTDPALRIVAIKSLAANWASRNYDEAFTWAQSLSDPNSRAYALSNVALRQAMHNMEKPADWISQLPDGFIQVRAAAGFALGALLRAKDETAAGQVREQLVADALDVARIREIISTSDLDTDARAQVLNLFE